MFSNQNVLPTDRMIAGTTRKLTFSLYDDDKQQIDVSGMIARFSISNLANEANNPIVSKNCTMEILDGIQSGNVTVTLDRDDTLSLGGKYIYQVTIKNSETVSVLKGIMNIDNNFDKLEI